MKDLEIIYEAELERLNEMLLSTSKPCPVCAAVCLQGFERDYKKRNCDCPVKDRCAAFVKLITELRYIHNDIVSDLQQLKEDKLGIGKNKK